MGLDDADHYRLDSCLSALIRTAEVAHANDPENRSWHLSNLPKPLSYYQIFPGLLLTHLMRMFLLPK